jgi:hypothetical protein
MLCGARGQVLPHRKEFGDLCGARQSTTTKGKLAGAQDCLSSRTNLTFARGPLRSAPVHAYADVVITFSRHMLNTIRDLRTSGRMTHAISGFCHNSES